MAQKKEAAKPLLVIKPYALEKLRYYVDNCQAEISGFGKVRETTKKNSDAISFEVYDIDILPQKVSGADATMKVEDVAAYLTRKIKAREKIEDIKLWWHSHFDFQAFFSATDDKTIKGSTEFPYLISLVTNQMGNYEARLDVHKPKHQTWELEVRTYEGNDGDLKAKCLKEIADMVKIERMFPASSFGFQGSQGGGSWSKMFDWYGWGQDKKAKKEEIAKARAEWGVREWEKAKFRGESDEEFYDRLMGDGVLYNAGYDDEFYMGYGGNPKRRGKNLDVGMQ